MVVLCSFVETTFFRFRDFRRGESSGGYARYENNGIFHPS